MPISSYTNFLNGVTIRNVPILQTHPGDVYWVDSATGSNAYNGKYNKPFGTLDYAVGRCTSGKGDIIVIKPGHTETISTATALALDVAGICVIGLGRGTSRPTFTLDTATTTTIAVSVANVAVINCIFTANFADIVSVFTLTTAKDFVLKDCYIKATATNMNFLSVVDTDATTNNCDGLTIENCTWLEPDLATLAMVKMDGTNDRVRIHCNYVRLGVSNNVASLMAIATGKVVTSMDVGYNLTYRLNTDTATGALLITTDGSTNSGFLYNNHSQHADTAAELIITASSGVGLFDNKSSGVVGNSGYIIATIDS